MTKPLVINIDGGLGRVIAMTGVITEVAKKREVRVITSRPLAFRGNPFIKSVSGIGDRALRENVVKGCDYINLEPYQDGDFYNDGKNWLDVAAKQLGVKVADPVLYLAEHEKLNNVLCPNCKVVLFQPFGSTMMINGADKSYRSFKVEDAQYIANALISAGYEVYVPEREDQPKLIGTNQLTADDLRWLVNLAARYPVIGCDSSMHHAAKAFGNPAVVMRAGTDSGRFGYKTSINLRNKAKYEYVPFRLGIDFNTDIQNQKCNIFDKEFLDNFIKESLALCEKFYGHPIIQEEPKKEE